MKYRTDEQWNEICDSVFNGNWTTAAEECEEYGFFSNDLIQKQVEELEANDCNQIKDLDLVCLAEMAMEIRGRKGYFK